MCFFYINQNKPKRTDLFLNENDLTLLSSSLFFRIIPSSYSLTMVMQRWCRCGFVAVWRRDAPSTLRDTSDVLVLSIHDGPGRLIPNLEHFSKASGSSMSICTVQVTQCTWTQITRCYKLYVRNS